MSNYSLTGVQKSSKLGTISEDSTADDDDTVSVYMFGDDEDQFEREARSNGGFIKFERVATHYGANVNNVRGQLRTTLVMAAVCIGTAYIEGYGAYFH